MCVSFGCFLIMITLFIYLLLVYLLLCCCLVVVIAFSFSFCSCVVCYYCFHFIVFHDSSLFVIRINYLLFHFVPFVYHFFMSCLYSCFICCHCCSSLILIFIRCLFHTCLTSFVYNVNYVLYVIYATQFTLIIFII